GLDESDRLFSAVGSAIGSGRVAQARGDLFGAQSRWRDAMSAYRLAEQRYREGGLAGGADRVQLEEAAGDVFDGKFAEAESLNASARDSSSKRGDWKPLLQLTNLLGTTYLSRGENERAERQFRFALTTCRDLENEKLALDPMLNLASLLNTTGRPGESEI